MRLVHLLQAEGKPAAFLTGPVQSGQNRLGYSSFVQELSLRPQDVTALCPCLQPALVDLAGGVAELDSDMADITQSVPAESIMGVKEDGELLAADVDVSEHNGVSASSQIASSLGINPHTLQVEPPPTQEVTSPSVRGQEGWTKRTRVLFGSGSGWLFFSAVLLKRGSDKKYYFIISFLHFSLFLKLQVAADLRAMNRIIHK